MKRNNVIAGIVNDAKSSFYGGLQNLKGKAIGNPLQPSHMNPASNRANVTVQEDPITMTIVNNSSLKMYAPIFNGSYQWLVPYGTGQATSQIYTGQAGDGGLPYASAGITITFAGSYSYQRLQQEAGSSPFTISSWKYLFNDTTQLGYQWEFQNLVGTGRNPDIFIPFNKFNGYQQNNTFMDFEWFQPVFGGYTLFIPVKANSAIVITANKQAQVQPGNALLADPLVDALIVGRPQPQTIQAV